MEKRLDTLFDPARLSDCRSKEGFWLNDEYFPTQVEIYQAMADADEMNYNMRTFGTIDRPKTHIREVKFPKWYTREQALELALEHVRGYEDRMFLQFLINVERRKNVS